MLPPIEPSILRDNPKFAKLYRHLTTSVLNPEDGSIKVSAAEAEAQSLVQDELIKARTADAKISILKHELRYLILTPDLPGELQDLILLLSNPRLTPHPLIPSLLSSIHPSALSALTPLLATRLLTLQSYLSRIADPTSTATTTTSPLAAQNISARKKSLANAQRELDERRLALATTAGEVLGTRREIDEIIVRTLEGVKFGTVARGVGAEVGYLAKIAEGMGEKLRLKTLELLQDIYDPDVVAAIQSYNAHLEILRSQLTSRANAARRALAEYEQEKDMKEIAARYAELKDEAEGVRVQIGRLGGDAES